MEFYMNKKKWEKENNTTMRMDDPYYEEGDYWSPKNVN
jgi:hypothetical protein